MAPNVVQHFPTTGACMCRKVQYKLEKPPIFSVACHCTNCRRITGSAFLTASIFHREDVTIISGEGFLKDFLDNTTDSGKPLRRRFCTECSSAMFMLTPLNEDIFSVAAGTMDNYDEYWPTVESYHGNRAAWLPELEDIERHVTHHWSPAPEGMPNKTSIGPKLIRRFPPGKSDS